MILEHFFASTLARIVFFPFLGAVFCCIYLYYSFHIADRFSGRRMFFYVVLIGYVLALLTLTLFPLPLSYQDCIHQIQLIPFHSIISLPVSEIQHISRIRHSHAFWQVILNILLFLPLGILSRYLWHCSREKALILGLSVSLFLEMQQATGFWGLHDCAWRLFDIDDIILNTTGTTLGRMAMRHIHGHFPTLGKDRKKKTKRHLRSYLLRIVGNRSVHVIGTSFLAIIISLTSGFGSIESLFTGGIISCLLVISTSLLSQDKRLPGERLIQEKRKTSYIMQFIEVVPLLISTMLLILPSGQYIFSSIFLVLGYYSYKFYLLARKKQK